MIEELGFQLPGHAAQILDGRHRLLGGHVESRTSFGKTAVFDESTSFGSLLEVYDWRATSRMEAPDMILAML